MNGPDPEPSAWVACFAALVREGGTALDLACGGGRHARLLLARGCRVAMLDRDTSRVADLASHPRAEILARDLEDGGPWPLAGRRFDGVVVANYLHRPILGHVLDAVAPGGALVYETFAEGNEAFGRPRNPDFLLRRGELRDLARAAGLRIVAFEDIAVAEPRPAVVQRIAAVRPGGREDFSVPP